MADLVAEVAARISALPAPRNGQVRAVPDERTVRYYGTIGLLDRPGAMRGRTALYGPKHLAQVIAIKRLQTMGRSLSEIQALWPTLDDRTLTRMSGVALPAIAPRRAPAEPPSAIPADRGAFWKQAPRGEVPSNTTVDLVAEVGTRVEPERAPAVVDGGAESPGSAVSPAVAGPVVPPAARAAEAPRGSIELRIELAPNVVLSLSVVDESVALSPADVRAIRAAAAPLVTELAQRRLASPPSEENDR